MTDANEVEFGNQASKVRLQDEVGKIKNRQGEACIEVIDNQNVGIGTDSPDRKLEILDDTNPQLRLTNVDNTEYLEIQSKATGDASIEMTDSNMWLRGGDSNCYLILQNTTTGKSDNTNVGLVLSTFGKSAGLNMYGAASTLKFGAAGLNAITIDASNNTTAINNLNTNGNVTLGDAAGDVHTLNGTLQFAQEVAAPSAPGSGDGGVFYVKTDGIPYFISDTTAETSLVGGGGGGTTTTGGTLITADPAPAVAGTMYLCNAASAFNVTLPTASAAGNGGTIDVCKASGANSITVLRAGSDTINGATSQVVSALYGNVTLISDGGTNWYIR